MNYRSHPGIQRAANAVMQGGVIAYPTEGVWGLGCDAFNPAPVSTILDLKNRKVEKGLILVAAQIEQFDWILRYLSEDQRSTLQNSWPGPFTWLVPHHGQIPPWISGNYDSVALRVSRHPIVQALCQHIGGPIVSTSANPQGRLAARYSFQVSRYFRAECRKGVITMAPGQTERNSKPSQIRDLISGEILRA